MKTPTRVICFFSLAVVSGFGQGTTLWNEFVNGPFSPDFHTPTALAALQPGTNSIIGATEVEPVGNNWVTHPDFFTITVSSLSAVSLVFVGIDKSNVWSWIGEPSYLNQIGFVASTSSGNLLNEWGIGSIGSGVYGVYLSNNDLQPFTSIANYRLDFFVEAVPEPSGLSLLLVGAGFVGLCCWRTFKSFRGAR